MDDLFAKYCPKCYEKCIGRFAGTPEQVRRILEHNDSGQGHMMLKSEYVCQSCNTVYDEFDTSLITTIYGDPPLKPGQKLAIAKRYAVLSASASFSYLLLLVLSIISLFVWWPAGIIGLVAACLCAMAAKKFNEKKLQILYGTEQGNLLNEQAWASGRKDIG